MSSLCIHNTYTDIKALRAISRTLRYHCYKMSVRLSFDAPDVLK